jgi:hypothetical protein
MTQLRDAHDRWLRIGPCAIAILFGASPLHAGAPQATDTGIRTLTGTTHEDSAAVARVVHRFHEALEAGDSLAGLCCTRTRSSWKAAARKPAPNTARTTCPGTSRSRAPSTVKRARSASRHEATSRGPRPSA